MCENTFESTRRVRVLSKNKKIVLFSTILGLQMVPKRGLEPPCLAALPPQGSASANFATWAHCKVYYKNFFTFSSFFLHHLFCSDTRGLSEQLPLFTRDQKPIKMPDWQKQQNQ